MRHLLSACLARFHAPFHGLMRCLVRTFAPASTPALDLLFVIPQSQRGWILEGICNEIAKHFAGTCAFHYSASELPPAKAYFFAHYSTLVSAYRRNPTLWRRKVFAWYTHPRDDLQLEAKELLYLLKRVDSIFCSCSRFARMLGTQGVEQGRVAFVPGGADPGLFAWHRRGAGTIGFCTAFYERKAPETIIEVVRMLPQHRFVLLGRHWEQYSRFEELKGLPNFRYIETDYSHYPSYYAAMDVFVSVSKLEGGPIPLIEAMMSNVVPVASRTGFAPDLIEHGKNGFLFDVDEKPAGICALIEKAVAFEGDVRQSVMHCTWEAFALQIQSLMGFVRGSGRELSAHPSQRPVEEGVRK